MQQKQKAGFRYIEHTVISTEPESDAISRIYKTAKENGIENPFVTIPGAYHTLFDFMRTNGLERVDNEVIHCFETYGQDCIYTMAGDGLISR